MTINIKDCSINYEQIGTGKDIILLHGWGQNIEMIRPLVDFLKYRYTIIDFPGFGNSSEPTTAWTIYDYADMLNELVLKLKIKKPILIGHSFGGRVAVSYGSKYDVDKIILLGTPIIRDEKTISFKTKLLKKIATIPGLKKLAEFAKQHVGSVDYKSATPIMREILVNVVNQDLSKEAANLKNEVLLIWGTDDEAAPLKDAKRLEQIIRNAGLVELPGLSHYAYLEALPQVKKIIKVFIGE